MDANSQRTAWPVPTDPVCGRTIEPVPIPYHAHHADTAYYFCSLRCRDRFQADPAAFVRRSGSLPVGLGLAPVDLQAVSI